MLSLENGESASEAGHYLDIGSGQAEARSVPGQESRDDDSEPLEIAQSNMWQLWGIDQFRTIM